MVLLAGPFPAGTPGWKGVLLSIGCAVFRSIMNFVCAKYFLSPPREQHEQREGLERHQQVRSHASSQPTLLASHRPRHCVGRELYWRGRRNSLRRCSMGHSSCRRCSRSRCQGWNSMCVSRSDRHYIHDCTCKSRLSLHRFHARCTDLQEHISRSDTPSSPYHTPAAPPC